MSTVSESSCTVLMSWPSVSGKVILSSDTKQGLIAHVQTNEKMGKIGKEYIVGIPKEIQRNEKILRRFLQHTYIRLTPIGDNAFSLRINPRLYGGVAGVLAALGGGFSAVSSVMNFFTSSNYVKLAHAAGSEARATVRVGGIEARATIDKAEDSAKNTLAKMGTEVRSSIDRAQTGAQEVIKTAGSEMNNTIGMAGIETRYTSKVMELQVEKVLGKASREAQLLLETAGMESKQSILLCGEEARKTCFALSQEMTTNIKTAGQETNLILAKGSLEVRSILDKANADVKSLIGLASDEFRQKSVLVLNEALSRAEQVVNETVKLAGLEAGKLIELLGKEAQGVIISLGNQGQLLIKDTGNEIRVIADEVLKKAFAGQEMIINAVGEEARLTVQNVGEEFRSTLREIPVIAGIAGEQFGRGLVFGLKEGFFGVSEAEEIKHKLKNMQGAPINIHDLLKFVYDQNKLSPQKKSILYKTVIDLFNNPSIKQSDRDLFLLLTGVAALKDKGLVEKDGRVFYGTDYRSKVIDQIPGDVGFRLKEKGEEAIESILPKAVPAPVVVVDPVNPLELEYEKQKMHIKALEAELLNAKTESVLLQVLSAEEKKRADESERKLMEISTEALTLSNRSRDLAKLVERQKREIDFLQPSEMADC